MYGCYTHILYYFCWRNYLPRVSTTSLATPAPECCCWHLLNADFEVSIDGLLDHGCLRLIFGGRSYTVCPPSTTRALPTTKLAASEHNHTTDAAISSGVPILPTGSCTITACLPSGVPPLNRCIMRVSMIPGHTALMRMFDSVIESSRLGQAYDAVLCGNIGCAPFEAFDPGTRGGVDDGAAPLLEHQRDFVFHAKTPRRSMSIIRSHSSSVTSAAGLMMYSIPALLKAISSRPNVSIVLSKALLTSSTFDTSHLTASARPPSCSPSSSSSIMRTVS